MGAMLSSPWAVSGVLLVSACGSCIVKPCIFCIFNMESQTFEVYSFSAFRFDFHTLLLYCVCTKCESFKSNEIKSIGKNSWENIITQLTLMNVLHVVYHFFVFANTNRALRPTGFSG